MFSPFAVIECEKSVPTEIVLFGICGFRRLLTIPLDPMLSRTEQVRFAIREANGRAAAYNGVVPFLGKPIAIVINYPGRAVRYDLQGRALEIIGQEQTVPEAELKIRGRPIASSHSDDIDNCLRQECERLGIEELLQILPSTFHRSL